MKSSCSLVKESCHFCATSESVGLLTRQLLIHLALLPCERCFQVQIICFTHSTRAHLDMVDPPYVLTMYIVHYHCEVHHQISGSGLGSLNGIYSVEWGNGSQNFILNILFLHQIVQQCKGAASNALGTSVWSRRFRFCGAAVIERPFGSTLRKSRIHIINEVIFSTKRPY